MIFVTFHGGKTGKNNVYAYASGKGASPVASPKPRSTKVLQVGSKTKLDELRGMKLAGPLLYVANGSKKTSNVLTFQGSGTSYTLKDTLISGSLVSIDHPFAMAFDQSGHCFVSNQDTNVVAILDVDKNGEKAKGGDVSSYLQGLKVKGKFLPSTFVASKNGTLPNVPAAPDLKSGQGGLKVAFSGKGSTLKVQNSVRDVALANGFLFVVDEPGGCVRIYNASSGKYYGKSGGGPLQSPTHLLIQGETLFVCAGKEIWSSALPKAKSKKPKLKFQSVTTVAAGDISGIAFDQEDPPNSYVAIRTGTPQILMGDANLQNLQAWIPKLPDSPEFLLYAPG